MADRVGRLRGFRRSQKRKTTWSGLVPQTALTAVAGSAQAILETFTPTVDGMTIVRVRGLFGVVTDQLAASEDMMGAVGLGVVTEQASSIGITAVPHPDTDSDWGGWLWHQYYSAAFLFGDATGFAGDAMARFVMDSKAMRKIGLQERLVLVIENSGVRGIQISNSFRVLLKLP